MTRNIKASPEFIFFPALSMIHKSPNVILPETLRLLIQLQQDEFFDDFFLVGGTSLALQIGHRLSVDLDFFNIGSFDNELVEHHLSKNYDFRTDFVAKNTLKGFIQNIKVDFITHAYPLVRALVSDEGFTLASIEDIGAMKLNAIAHSGNRQKDFYDLFFLLEHFSLKDLLAAYEYKYANSNPIIPLKGITWFEDIDFEIEKPMLVQKVTFAEVKNRLLEATNRPSHVFSGR